MNAKLLKATTIILVGLLASASIAQDDSVASEVPAGPTPQELSLIHI